MYWRKGYPTPGSERREVNLHYIDFDCYNKTLQKYPSALNLEKEVISTDQQSE